jgi:hypothetical protein
MFLQPDWFEVLKPGVGTNRFSYSFNDPVNKLDPMGNDWNPTDGSEFHVQPAFSSLTYAQQMTNVCSAGACAMVGLAVGGPTISVARSAINVIASKAPGLFIGATEIATAEATGMTVGAGGAAVVLNRTGGLQIGQVGTYAELKAIRRSFGQADGFHVDHVPSRAAIIKAEKI